MGVVAEIKPGYKKTKLGWIPVDWEVIRLENVCDEFKSGFGITSKHISKSGAFPVFGGNGLRGYASNFTHEGHYVLIGRQGALCGNIVQVYGKNYISEHAIAVNTNKDNDNSFLAFKLEYLKLNRLSESSAQPGLAVGKLLRYKVSLPPLLEQKKIADILSAWDNAIETTQALIEKLKLRKKGVMQQLLSGEKRLPGFTKEWKEIKFSDIISERSEYPVNELPLYSLTIQDGVTPKTERYERSFLLTTKVNAYKKMCKGDFALNPMNLRFGAIAMHKGDIDVCVSKYYNIFYCLESCNPIFFEYYLKSYPMIQYYNKMAIGSLEEKKRVHYKDFLKFKKNLPSKEEQTAIAQVFSQADESIFQTQKYLDQLQEQKKGLMQQLLTGQKRVKV